MDSWCGNRVLIGLTALELALECWNNVGSAGNAPGISSIRSQTEETFVEDRMGKQRQSWTVEEKLGIVLAVLSERPSVAEVARQRGVNENQI